MRVSLTILIVIMGLAAAYPSFHPANVLADTAIPTAQGNASQQPEGVFTSANEQGQYRYLITFSEPGLLRQTKLGEHFNPERMAVARNALVTQQAAHRQTMANTLGRSLEVTHNYLVTRSGLAAWLSEEEASEISRLPSIASIERERQYELATHAGPWFIGADSVWDGSNTPDNNGLRGEGMIIAVLDTGIDPAHPSFANDPACGHGQGGAPDKLISYLDCSGTDAEGLCNGPNPVDTHGHGSHVSSTAAGNRLDQTAEPPPQPPGDASEISGVAPCANLRSYRVCPGTGCQGSYILSGLESALIHGDVDVLNYSISGGTNPWQDLDRPKLDLVEAGILIATAAGNTGPGAPHPVAQVNHRGPWVLSVAASTHDGGSGPALISVTGIEPPPAELINIIGTTGSASPIPEGVLDLPIRHFDQQPSDWEGCTPGVDEGSGPAPGEMPAFPDDFFAGAAALIQRGGCSFVTKIVNAYDAGAELVIIRNNDFGGLAMGTDGQPDIPAIAIMLNQGIAMQDYLDQHPDTATISVQVPAGDVLGNFSLRGPTPQPLQNLTKPDITAPGVGIYAAVPESVNDEGYNQQSGTSMASPHVAGAAAMVRQAHPDWTPPEVMSALMTTASNPGRKDNLIQPWNSDDVGSGRVDLTKAALAGLVMHETTTNYLAADPDLDGDVRSLNIPSLRDLNCIPECTFTRTVRNTLNTPSQWEAVDGQTEGSPPFEITVDPQTFTFTGDITETQELTITITPLQNNQTGAIAFGQLLFTETADLAPDQHLTVAIRGRPAQPLIELDPTSFVLELNNDAPATHTLNIANAGELPLHWQITETTASAQHADLHSAGRLNQGDINCDHEPGILINDTGLVGAGYTEAPPIDQLMFMDRYTPLQLPADFTAVCIAFSSSSAASLNFEIVIYDDDGPDGRPGTELGAMPATFEGLQPFSSIPNWRSFDISPLGITAESGSVYVGVRWTTSTSPVHLSFDTSPVNPAGHGGGWWWVSPYDFWAPIQHIRPNYRALFVRPITELGDLVCDLPSWLNVDVTDGVIDPQQDQSVQISFDPTGLDEGEYKAFVCLQTNDPGRGIAALPLALTVVDEDRVFRDRFQVPPTP